MSDSLNEVVSVYLFLVQQTNEYRTQLLAPFPGSRAIAAEDAPPSSCPSILVVQRSVLDGTLLQQRPPQMHMPKVDQSFSAEWFFFSRLGRKLKSDTGNLCSFASLIQSRYLLRQLSLELCF
ncbi:unnamed protein product [Heligmosomoides polygyrus]|uniref:Uncharacterized protein n=1 Tax=Heligmosomoides polygyrus TaxID=6339 RepID=A0A183FWZ7_HELPZ|nr:unnamed protein product [Heligmosomoides polygyrus]